MANDRTTSLTSERICILHHEERIDDATSANACGYLERPEAYPYFGVSSLKRCEEAWAARSASSADPVLDEQIRDLYGEALESGDRDLASLASKALALWWSGLDAEVRWRHADEIAEARVKCAALIASRAAVSP